MLLFCCKGLVLSHYISSGTMISRVSPGVLWRIAAGRKGSFCFGGYITVQLLSCQPGVAVVYCFVYEVLSFQVKH